LFYLIEVLLSVISGEENKHLAHASLHDVMRKIWNDHAGFSPEFRENYPQRLERLERLELASV
jgi:inactivated superfamily I helicase